MSNIVPFPAPPAPVVLHLPVCRTIKLPALLAAEVALAAHAAGSTPNEFTITALHYFLSLSSLGPPEAA